MRSKSLISFFNYRLRTVFDISFKLGGGTGGEKKEKGGERGKLD